MLRGTDIIGQCHQKTKHNEARLHILNIYAVNWQLYIHCTIGIYLSLRYVIDSLRICDIDHFRVGSISKRRRSEAFCYLGLNHNRELESSDLVNISGTNCNFNLFSMVDLIVPYDKFRQESSNIHSEWLIAAIYGPDLLFVHPVYQDIPLIHFWFSKTHENILSSTSPRCMCRLYHLGVLGAVIKFYRFVEDRIRRHP